MRDRVGKKCVSVCEAKPYNILEATVDVPELDCKVRRVCSTEREREEEATALM